MCMFYKFKCFKYILLVYYVFAIWLYFVALLHCRNDLILNNTIALSKSYVRAKLLDVLTFSILT